MPCARTRLGRAVVVIALAAAAPARAHEPTPEPTDATPAPARPYASKVVARPPATATERHADAQTIQATPRRSGDDLLRLVPGLVLLRHGAEGKGPQLVWRGFDAAHGADVEVLVGGIPLNEPSNVHGQGYLDLGVVIPEAVLAQDALAGSFQLSQGPFATAGSLRLQLGVPAALRGARVGFEAGMYLHERLVAVVAPRGLPEATFVAVEAVRDAGFGPNRDSERAALVAQAELWRREHRGRLEALAAAHAGRFGEAGTVPTRDVAAGRLGFYDTWARWQRSDAARAFAGLRYRLDGHHDTVEALAFAGYRRLSLVENFTGRLAEPARGDTRRQFHEAASGGLKLRYARRFPHGLALLAGGELRSEGVSQYEDAVGDDARAFRRNRDLAFTQTFAAAQLGLRWLHRRVQLEGGLRVDVLHFAVTERLDGRSAQAALAVPSPRLTSSFDAGGGVSLFAAYGRGLRPPEASAALAEARPTTSDAVEIGARFSHPRVALSAAGFGTWLAHEVLFDHLSGQNIALGPTRRLGVALAAQVQPLPFLALRADLTYVDARFTDTGNAVPNVPPVMLQLGAWLTGWRGLRVGARFYYLSPRPLPFGASAGDIAQLDLLVSWRHGPLQLDAQLDNATAAAWKAGEFNHASHWDATQPRSFLPALHYAAGQPITFRAGVTLWL